MSRLALPVQIDDEQKFHGVPLVEKPDRGFIEETALTMSASWLNGVRQAETGSIIKAVDLFTRDQIGPKVSPEDLNKEFPNLQKPFSEPRTMSAAKEIAQRNRDQRTRDEFLQGVKKDSTLQTMVSFGANMIPQILDPVGIAIGAVVGGGLHKVLAMAGKGVKGGILASKVGKTLFKGTKQGLKSTTVGNIAEGLVGNIIGEGAIVIPASQQEQFDVDTYQSLANVVAGSIGFPLVIKGAGKLLGADRVTKASMLVESQLQKGKKPDISDMDSAMRKQELPSLRKDLKEAKALNDQESIKNISDEIKEIEELPNTDKVSVMEKANSDAEDLYHDPEVEAALNDKNIVQDETLDGVNLQKENAQTAIDEMEAVRGEFDEVELKELDEAKADLARVEELDTAAKMATNCVVKG